MTVVRRWDWNQFLIRRERQSKRRLAATDKPVDAGYVYNSLPAYFESAISKYTFLRGEDFRSLFKTRLGLYRGAIAAGTSDVPKAIKGVQDVLDSIHALQEKLRKLPESIRDTANDAIEHFDGEARLLWNALALAERELPSPAPKGPKELSARDELLASMFDRVNELAVATGNARQAMAAFRDIFVDTGVRIPDDVRDIVKRNK
jgi:hypothetical protein